MRSKDEAPIEDALFGRLAVRENFLSEKDAQFALQKQRDLEEQGEKKKLGEILVEYHMLTPQEVRKVLDLQIAALLKCPGCGSSFNIEGFKPGKSFRCKECKTLLRVPEVSAVAEVTIEDPEPASPRIVEAAEAPPIKQTWIFGKVAIALGLITPEQARQAATMQEELAAGGETLDFGEVLVELDFITHDMVQEVLDARWGAKVDPDDALFGSIAVENGFLDSAALEKCLSLQRELGEEFGDSSDVPRIAEILLMEEKLDASVVESILKVQERLKKRETGEPTRAVSPAPSQTKKKFKVRSPRDALFFKVGIRNRFLSPGHVGVILERQMGDPRPWTVGDLAVELGILEPLDVGAIEEIIARKEGMRERTKKHVTTASIRIHKEDAEFGTAALHNGFLDKAGLKEAEKAFKVLEFLEYPRSLPEILFDQSRLTAEQIRAVSDVLKLKGAALPSPKLDETLLTEREDLIVQALVNEGEQVSQGRVTECLKIRKELRKCGIERKLGEVMLVKGYLHRDDIRRRPLPKRERTPGPSSASLQAVSGSRNTVFLAAGAGVVLVLLALVVGLAMRGGGDNRTKTSPEDTEGAPLEPVREKMKPRSKSAGPPSEDQAVKLGMVKWKHKWISKEKFKAESRREFYEALREAVAARQPR
ncbi:MAG: hypothetical protein ACYTFG_07265 [Planctomycetota bacterium]|jgi:hypothetical protein